MRLRPFFLLAGCLAVSEAPDPANAQESAPRPDMRQVLSTFVKQHSPELPAPSKSTSSSPAPAPHDPDLVTLPAILVSAAVLRVPPPEDIVRPVIGAVRVVSYGEYIKHDAHRQSQMHDLLELADLAQHSGDGEVADKMRRETYRSLVRNPTPLERAMDRSANGGRY